MKNVNNSALHCKSNALPSQHKSSSAKNAMFLFTIITAGMLFTGCKKDAVLEENVSSHKASHAIVGEENVLNQYTGLPAMTMWELQQARAATARYRHLSNAKKDGYVDINVVAPNMGYHYMNMSLVADGVVDIKKPEILVYNKDEDGNFYLVAVEYAVPLSAPMPSGFSGTHDVWDGNAGFQLWLLHAWVWSYNPSGVFNPTNPLVHLH